VAPRRVPESSLALESTNVVVADPTLSRQRYASLIREMSIANPAVDAPRIHGELLTRIDIGADRAVAQVYGEAQATSREPGRRFFITCRRPRGIDLFVVPTDLVRRL